MFLEQSLCLKTKRGKGSNTGQKDEPVRAVTSSWARTRTQWEIQPWTEAIQRGDTCKEVQCYRGHNTNTIKYWDQYVAEMSPSPILKISLWTNMALWESGPLHGPRPVIRGMRWTGVLGDVGCVLFFSKKCKYRAGLHSPCRWSRQIGCWGSWSVPSPDSVFHVPAGRPQHRGASEAVHQCRYLGCHQPCDRGNLSQYYIPWGHKGQPFLQHYHSLHHRSRTLQNIQYRRPRSHRKFSCFHPGCRRSCCYRHQLRIGQVGRQRQRSFDHKSPKLNWNLFVPGQISL